MASFGFWRRYLARYATLAAAPRFVGPRDRLHYYERAPLWRPEQGLSAFIAELVRDQQLAEEAPRVRAFLEFWAPRQALAARGSVLIEFSFTTNKPGFGMMLYGENRAMTRAFREWCRIEGIAEDLAGRSAAICATFDDADLAMVRAEFRPGDPTRTSLTSSWFFDPLRWSGGISSRLARLPPAYQDPALTARVRAIEARLMPDFFPLFLGFSRDGGATESKVYFVRYANEPPLAPEGRVSRLLDDLQMDAARLAQVRAAFLRLWEASSEPMTQVLLDVSGNTTQPPRMNLITCGTRTGAVKDALRELDDPRFDPRSVLPFERVLQTGRAKYVALRLTPAGLSPRVKLYGQACFALGS